MEGWAASGVLPARRLWRRRAAAWPSQKVKVGGRRRAEGRRRGWRGGRRAARGTERGSARRADRSAPPSLVSAIWLAGFETKPAKKRRKIMNIFVVSFSLHIRSYQ